MSSWKWGLRVVREYALASPDLANLLLTFIRYWLFAFSLARDAVYHADVKDRVAWTERFSWRMARN